MKKLAPLVLCIAVLLSCFVPAAVFASTFTDVKDDFWAAKDIDAMTEAGYIKGYGDGKFGPNDSVTKIQSLLLLSRMLGVDTEEFSTIRSNSLNEYDAAVKKYNTTYPNELSYLMYFGVIEDSDLATFASSANANTNLLRYQAATLVVKLLGAEEVADNNVTKTSYSDDSQIPSAAKGAVKYVTDNKIMNGMGNDTSGNPTFSPNSTLTRAQMATLLARLIPTLNLNIYSGEISNINYDSVSFDISRESAIMEDNTVIRLNGKASDFDQLKNGDDVTLVFTCGEERLVDVTAGVQGTAVYGRVKSANSASSSQTITIYDAENESDSATYTLSSNCEIYVNNAVGTLSGIKTGDFVKVILKNGAASKIETQNKNSTVSGTLKEVSYDKNGRSFVEFYNKDEELEKFEVTSGTVTVTRNNNNSSLRELAEGDKISLSLTYGKITKITATSKSTSITGTIEEIILSSTPSITLDIDGKSTNYKISQGATVEVAGEKATIYDLRPGNVVSVKLDSNQISSISTTSTNNSGVRTEIQGTVTAINTNLSVITIELENGSTENVYYNSRTSFMAASDGKSISAKTLVKGNEITATGSDASGYFEATIVIVK